MSQSLDNVMQSLQKLQARVREMPRGGDLESLIEEGLAEINREFFESCVSARQETSASSESGGFPPWGVPEVRREGAPCDDAPEADSDPSR